MGRLVIKLLQILFIAVLNIQIINCDRTVADEAWVIEWYFIDTVSPIDQISYQIDIETEISSHNRHRKGILDSTGILHEGFNSVAKEEFLETNPMFYLKLFRADSTVVYDSLFTWEQMDFKEQYSVIDNKVRENVSKRTIYLSTLKYEKLNSIKEKISQ